MAPRRPCQALYEAANPERVKEWRGTERKTFKQRYHEDPEFRRQYLSKHAAWRKKNPGRDQEYHNKVRDRKRVQIAAIKAERGCLHCPERDHRCLDFHHRDAESKTWSVAEFLKRSHRMERILAEIAKCDVICSNCHRKLHEGNRMLRRAHR